MKKKDLRELLKKREEAKKPKEVEVKEPEGDQDGNTDDNTADNNG